MKQAPKPWRHASNLLQIHFLLLSVFPHDLEIVWPTDGSSHYIASPPQICCQNLRGMGVRSKKAFPLKDGRKFTNQFKSW